MTDDASAQNCGQLREELAELRRAHAADSERLVRDMHTDSATLRLEMETGRSAAWTSLVWVIGVLMFVLVIAVGALQSQITSAGERIEVHREQSAHAGSAALHSSTATSLKQLGVGMRELAHRIESHRDLASHPGAAVQLGALESRVERLEADIRNHKTALDALQTMLTRVDANTRIQLRPRAQLGMEPGGDDR